MNFTRLIHWFELQLCIKVRLCAFQLSLNQKASIVSTWSRSQVCYLCCLFNTLLSFLYYLSRLKIAWIKSQLRQHPFSCSTACTRTHRDHDAGIHPGWRLIPVADESRHDGSEACNVIYRAGLTFQIQSGTLITDENLRQEIALIAN